MTIRDPEREIAYRLRLAEAGPQPSLLGPLIPVIVAMLLVTDTLLPAMSLLNCVAPLAGFILAWMWDETPEAATMEGAVASF
jgi:hypothetical protein